MLGRLSVLVASVCAAAALVAAVPGRASSPARRPVTALRPMPTAQQVVVYRAPVPGRLQVLRRFVPPRSRYGAGHRGVDLRAGSVVLAAGAGVVTFAGSVAGRGVVVVAHADGVRTEYEPVTAGVHAGDRVRAGQVLGAITGTHRGCPGHCLHWGARRGVRYLDPLSLLRPLGPVRLLPWTHGPP